MNLIKCFDQYNFDKFPNRYAIKRTVDHVWSTGYSPDDFFIRKKFEFETLKIYVSLKDNVKKKYLLIGSARHYTPIYGHFYNNANHFLYKKIFNKQIQTVFEPVKYHIIKSDELAKAGVHNYYFCHSIDHTYDTIKKLKAYDLPDIYTDEYLIKDEEEFSSLYSYDNLYSYENGTLIEYLSDDQIAFTYDSETNTLHMI